jgi:hypothetical protein
MASDFRDHERAFGFTPALMVERFDDASETDDASEAANASEAAMSPQPQEPEGSTLFERAQASSA